MATVKVNGRNSVTVDGIIKNQEDYNEIKTKLQELVDGGSREIIIDITESSSISSSVIGYLMKIVNKDDVKLSIKVRDAKLYKIMSDLSLVDKFGVQKI